MGKELLRWLHISDVHYMGGPSQEYIHDLINDAITEFSEKRGKVDCVIISGDFFQQGENNSNLENWIQQICKICLKRDAPEDDWKEFWKTRVLFCPGNHDLNRDAYRLTKKKLLHRRDLLQPEEGRIAYPSKSGKYKLLIEDSFALFDEVITKRLAENDDAKFGEYRMFEVPDSNGGSVLFVGLNTALFAGQIADKKTLEKNLAEARENFENADSCKDGYQSAEKAYKEYLNRYREFAERLPNDEGKLGFISKGSVDAITDKINNGHYSAVVVFGHHPISDFSEKGKGCFWKAVSKKWGAKLYLCGHEHQPKVLKEKITIKNGGNTDDHFVNEIKVGGNFSDWTPWNVPSFALCTLFEEDKREADGTTSLSLEGDIVFRVRYCDDGENAIIANVKNIFPYIPNDLNEESRDWIQSHFVNKETIEEGSWNRAWKAYHFGIEDAGEGSSISGNLGADESRQPDDPVDLEKNKIQNKPEMPAGEEIRNKDDEKYGYSGPLSPVF